MNYKLNTIIILIIVFAISSPVFMAEKSIDWESVRGNSINKLKDNPDDIITNFTLSISLSNLGKIEEAYNLIESLEENISKDDFNKTIGDKLKLLADYPDDILLLNYAAFAATINNQYKESIHYFDRILIIEPNNIWIMNYQAAAYVELKDYKVAEEILNNTLKIKNNKYSHLLLGIIHYKNGKILKALAEAGLAGDLVGKLIFK